MTGGTRELRAVWYLGQDGAESCSAQDLAAWTVKMGRDPDAFGLYRNELDGTQTHERDYPMEGTR